MPDNQNKLAYKLHKQLLNVVDKFIADHYDQLTVSVLYGAANLFLSGIAVNSPSKLAALATIAECYEIQKSMLKMTPDSFFGKGLEQNPDLN